MASRRASPSTDLADRLHTAAIRLLRRLRRQDDASGLSAPRLSALSVLVFAGPRTLGELAAAEQVRPPTMSRLVAALEAQGLLARAGDPADARRVILTATARGRQILLAGRARRVAALARELSGLQPAERAALQRAVEILEGLPPEPPQAPIASSASRAHSGTSRR
jgi:DNA-binding MarR family transcriptional regulator